MADAQLRLRKLVVTPQGGRPFLLVEGEITLPTGVLAFQIPGQVVASLVVHLAEIQQQHPELCGVVGRVTDRLDWEGRVDPAKVEQN